jgi:hypothetical protein
MQDSGTNLPDTKGGLYAYLCGKILEKELG